MSEFIPSSFFIDIPAALYDFVYNMFFFMFRYRPLLNQSLEVSYTNPFSQVEISYYAPYLPDSFNSVISETLDVFGIDPCFTFFELVCSSFFIIILAYAFIKYLNPL